MGKSGLSYDKKQFAAVANLMTEKIEKLEEAIEFEFIQVLGPATTTHAKSYSTFKDQTGNLRSSIGFILAKNGAVIDEGGFKQVNGPEGNTGEGLRKGRAYAEELARSSGRGYVLIVVAGMNYAGYVEAKGYNVLTESGTYLESQVNKMINRILKKAGFR